MKYVSSEHCLEKTYLFGSFCVNRELPDVQAEFRKSRGTRDQIANICWIIEKASKFQENIYFCFIDYAKALAVQITTNCGKFFKR